ncbi:unnamed protein product [Adineta ricciae]|nr:unnamed protein product [Adineta ricciae]
MKIAIITLLSIIFASLLHFNFTINFYIFILISSRFRRQAKSVLVKKCWRSIQRCLHKMPTNIRMNRISPGKPPPNSSSNTPE